MQGELGVCSKGHLCSLIPIEMVMHGCRAVGSDVHRGVDPIIYWVIVMLRKLASHVTENWVFTLRKIGLLRCFSDTPGLDPPTFTVVRVS